MISAPANSYTRRLFNDPDLLKNKILEEAGELCEATVKNDVAWEAADLLYFAFVRCVSLGVELSDIESHLNRRAKKITRRPGNAKPAAITLSKHKEPIEMDISLLKFEMKVIDSISLSPSDRLDLLKRPIIDTQEIMSRVRPIVQEVKDDGDVAVRKFTSLFDKVDLESVVLKSPFPAELMLIEPSVKSAIDQAYENITKFHVAQLDSEPLVVETMPGITCSRFIRPIERVGLYVPGGTAILPSSALMLGIPAKVAGCKDIIFATPPRSDGSITPEVVYVAHKVGASLILKAGGAQAVSAMAYGTETVPKVDKICGPGNQYVTAAKMITTVYLNL